ncbi:MAG: decaprenyl-phosphate phosphoribosyltransferase [Solirubrobacteraceae bacterium]
MAPGHAGDDGRRAGQSFRAPTAAAYPPAGGEASAAPGLLEAPPGERLRGEPAAGARRRILAYVALARPRQWVKNLLVVAAPAAAGVLGDGAVVLRIAVAFTAFCLLSAATYMINDVRDADEDREHPRKRTRPVAAGELEPRAVLRVAAAVMLTGLLLCLLVRPLLLAVGGGYLAVTLTYTLLWRKLVLADVGAIAAGFMLRAIAGGVAAPVPLSRSFVLVVTFGAVFVAAGKRHAELVRPGRAAGPARRVLAVYTVSRLRQVLTASAALAFAAYCVWALEPHAADESPWRALTVIPFAACLLRYGALLRRGDGEAPEELLLDDRLLQLLALAWMVVFAMSVHAAG